MEKSKKYLISYEVYKYPYSIKLSDTKNYYWFRFILSNWFINFIIYSIDYEI